MNCNKCNQEIHFDNSVTSSSGKKIPLEGKAGFDKHDCPNNPYKGFANQANKTVDSAFTDKPVLERIEQKLNKLSELLEAVLINQGLYKPANQLEVDPNED